MAAGDADATADDAAAADDGLRGAGIVLQRVQRLPDRAGGEVHLRGVPAEFVHRHVTLKLHDNRVHAFIWLFDLSACYFSWQLLVLDVRCILYVFLRVSFFCITIV
jgi:hypothetical protein